MPEEVPPPTPHGDHARLADELGAGTTTYELLADGTGVTVVSPDDLFTAARRVRDYGYEVLSLLSAYDRDDHFGVLYAFLKLTDDPAHFGEMRLRVTMPRKEGDKPVEPACPSLCDLWPAANWQEREMYDMYGIRFEGHPDLRRMFLPEGWQGFPMRRDDKTPEQFVGLAEGEDIVVPIQEEGSW